MGNITTFRNNKKALNDIHWTSADAYSEEYQKLFGLVYENNHGYGDCQMIKSTIADKYDIYAIIRTSRRMPVNIESVRSALEQVASLYRSGKHILNKQFDGEWPTNDLCITALRGVHIAHRTFSFDEFISVINEVFDGIDINIFVEEWE